MPLQTRSDGMLAAYLRALRADYLLLLPIGFFGGAGHALPEQLYVGEAFGPFDLLALLLLAGWVLGTPRRIDRQALHASVPFLLLALFAYVGEIAGNVTFGGNTWSGIFAPLRFLFYPTLFVTLVPLLTSEERLRTLFLSFACGVLAVALLAWVQSPDPSFFFGLPVLYNPNVIGNFIGYAMICLGFRFIPRGSLSKLALLLVLFVLALFTFSKASWLLALGGLYVNAIRMTKLRLVVISAAMIGAAVAFVNWQDLFQLVSTAIDLKLASSVGDDSGGGTLYMRLGFLLSSLYSLLDYPLGVGLKNFWLLNYSYAQDLGTLYFDSESPHTALGFMTVQAGWLGVGLLAVIFHSVVKAQFVLYGTARLGIRIALVLLLAVSVMFQIEFLTQPFIYLSLAAAIAWRKHIAGPSVGPPTTLPDSQRL